MKIKFKKILILLILIFTLGSCNKPNFNVSILQNTNVKVRDNDIALITNKEKLNSYSSLERFKDSSFHFKDKLNNYNDQYFNENILVVINLKENSSNKISVKNIDIKGEKMIITLNRINNENNNEYKIYSIFIESNNKEIEEVSYKF